jgi:hypothetical protein
MNRMENLVEVKETLDRELVVGGQDGGVDNDES